MKNDNQNGRKKKGRIHYTKVRGVPGIYKVSVWDARKGKHVDPRMIPECTQKPYRAFRRIRKMGKLHQQARFCDCLEEARAWRLEVNPNSSIVIDKTYRVENLIQDWRGWSRPPRMRESTWEIYGKDLRHFRFLEPVPVEQLSPHDIDAWLRHLLDPSYPKKASRTSFVREIKSLTTILAWYREYKNHGFQSPILKRHKRDARLVEKAMREEMALTPEELNGFLTRLRMKHRPVYYYLASFQALCGARIGEACGLLWSAVDLETGFVEIRRVCSWTYKSKQPRMVESTKTNEIRRVAMPERLVHLLREWKETGAQGEIVFHMNGELMRYNAVQSAYKKAFRALGLPEKSTHVLRHTFATIYATQTKDIRATQAAMGHRDLRITQHYAKLTEETQKQALPSFEFGKLPTTEPPRPPQKGGR